MADNKQRNYNWPRRGPAERRLHPRVRISFPIMVEVEDQPRIEGHTVDLGLGGVRAILTRYLPLFTRLSLTMELPVTGREEVMRFHPVQATVAVVRIEPDEEAEEDTEYDVSLAFTGVSDERDRIIGVFMLQTLLFDRDAELT